MKKVLLSLSFAAIAFLSNAQTRSIDWTVDSIAGPSEVSSTEAGSTFNFDFTLKNLGTDTVEIGDSIWYQITITNANASQIIAIYPGQNQFAVRKATRQILPQDTAHVVLPLAINLKPNQSSKIAAIIVSHVLNRPGLDFETNRDNNAKALANITWWNVEKWPVGIKEELEGVSFNVFPNPATTVVNFETEYNKASKIEILDITGRLIETVDFTMGSTQVNTTNYSNGVYIYNVSNTDGVVVKTGKFSVN
jgi:hypothetical protein